MKILHLPTSVGGNSHNLSIGERALGFNSQTLVSFENWLEYETDVNLRLSQSNKFRAITTLVKTFFKIRNSFDVFHFNYGSSLLHFPTKGLLQLDLPFYKSSSKKFVTYAGCDARQKYPTMTRTTIAACHNSKCYKSQCNSGFLDKQRKKSIEKMEKYVDHIWALNPDLLFFLPKEKSSFLPYSVVSEKFKFEPLNPQYPIKIVHAPTNREAKGSSFILNALYKLKEKYPNKVEILLVENIPHVQALELYKSADLFIDQILIGWYGVVAVEAMMLGKPVISRIAEENFQFISKEMSEDIKNTIINADPFSIEYIIEKYIKEKDLLIEKSKMSRDFALKWHDSYTVSQITTKVYAGLS